MPLQRGLCQCLRERGRRHRCSSQRLRRQRSGVGHECPSVRRELHCDGPSRECHGGERRCGRHAELRRGRSGHGPRSAIRGYRRPFLGGWCPVTSQRGPLVVAGLLQPVARQLVVGSGHLGRSQRGSCSRHWLLHGRRRAPVCRTGRRGRSTSARLRRPGSHSRCWASDEVSVGSTSEDGGQSTRRITNVRAGTSDTDVANLGQVRQAAQALGGGATFVNGNFVAPIFQFRSGATYNTVEAAMDDLDGRLTVQEQNPCGGSGTPGPRGADGLSAYEVALANGFQGNEQVWLASLKGARGTRACRQRWGGWNRRQRHGLDCKGGQEHRSHRERGWHPNRGGQRQRSTV